MIIIDNKLAKWVKTFEDSPLHSQLHLKLKPIYCMLYRNVIKMALFAIKKGRFQMDNIDILNIIR